MVAVEAAGDLLIDGGLRQQVAGQLPDRELIERQIVIQRPDHPVAPDPLPGVAILLETVAIGVPSGVEPAERHALAVMPVGEQAIDEPVVRFWVAIGDERVDLVRGRREPHKVDRQPLDERGPVGLRRRGQPFGFELGEDELVDRIAHPVGAPHRGLGRAHGRDESPVRGVCGPLGDPSFQDRLLLGRQSSIRLRRRHQLAGILRVDPPDQLARLGIVRDDRVGIDRGVSDVESQLGLAFIRILPVAIEAVLREDRPDIAIEVQGGRRGLRFAGRDQERETDRQEEKD